MLQRIQINLKRSRLELEWIEKHKGLGSFLAFPLSLNKEGGFISFL